MEKIDMMILKGNIENHMFEIENYPLCKKEGDIILELIEEKIAADKEVDDGK